MAAYQLSEKLKQEYDLNNTYEYRRCTPLFRLIDMGQI
jgi:hypothetical protein